MSPRHRNAQPQVARPRGKTEDAQEYTEKSEESGAHRAQRLKLVDENGTAVVRSHQTSRFDCEKNEWRNNQEHDTGGIFVNRVRQYTVFRREVSSL